MHLTTKNEVDPQIKLLEKQYVDLIKNRFGIVMHVHQNYELFKTIQNACDRFNLSPAEYLHQLKSVSKDSPLLEQLIAGITVGETYFFRDKQQMQLLQQIILPDIIENKRKIHSPFLRIWSAGCATGEEIYSIAMMLYEILPDIDKWTIKLLATDINTSILKKAIMGSYTEWSMRAITDYFRGKYFHKDKKHYLLDKSLKEHVNFEYLNLNEDSYPSIFNGTNAQDLIICRNVLIYIETESCKRLMKKMYSSLVPGGYLMLGASDPLHIAGTHFILHDRKCSLYIRPIESAKIENKKINRHSIDSVIPQTSAKVVPKNEITTTKIDESDFIAQATQLANTGKLKEAIELCQKMFKAEPTNKLNYYTYALAMSELDELSEAESALRKTLFLDNEFVAGHFQLGLLLLRKNQHEAGLKSLKNALAIAECKNSDEFVPGSPDLSYSQFADILRNEISLYDNRN